MKSACERGLNLRSTECRLLDRSQTTSASPRRELLSANSCTWGSIPGMVGSAVHTSMSGRILLPTVNHWSCGVLVAIPPTSNAALISLASVDGSESVEDCTRTNIPENGFNTDDLGSAPASCAFNRRGCIAIRKSRLSASRSASEVFALVKSRSNCLNCASWRWLIIRPVTSAPAPATNVRSRKSWAAQSNTVLSPSTVIDEILDGRFKLVHHLIFMLTESSWPRAPFFDLCDEEIRSCSSQQRRRAAGI